MGGPERISASAGAAWLPPRRQESAVGPKDVDPADANPPRPGTALVAAGPRPDADRGAPSSPRSAAFLAHLIATAIDAPQTRARRRAAPAEAAAAYRATEATVPVPGSSRRSA